MRPDRQTAQRPHVRARPQFTDCSQQEEPCGFSISFSARQTYQPSSGGAPSARAHLKAHGHTLAYCLYKKTHARGINSIKSLSFRPCSTSAGSVSPLSANHHILTSYSPKPFLIQQPPNRPSHCLLQPSGCPACAGPVHKHTTTNTNNRPTHSETVNPCAR